MKMTGHAVLGERGVVLLNVESDSHPAFYWECQPKELRKLALALTRLAEMAEKTTLRAGQKPVKLGVTV